VAPAAGFFDGLAGGLRFELGELGLHGALELGGLVELGA
jgi:hypothetical protein